MYLPPFSIISKKIIFYLNMFLTHPQPKLFFKKNLFLTFLILNNSAILKTTLITGFILIFSNFITFNTNCFQILTLNANTKEEIHILTFFRKFFRHNYQLIWHSKLQSVCVNSPQHVTNDELLPFIDNPDNQHPQFVNLLDFPSTHFSYLTFDSKSIDKSLNLPPPIRPYAKQNLLPPSIDTTSNVSLQTLPSSSNVILNTNPSSNQNFPPSTSQTTTITTNPSISSTPNQYTTPSNTPPVLPSNTAQLPVYQFPTIPPIPLSLINTLNTQPSF